MEQLDNHIQSDVAITTDTSSFDNSTSETSVTDSPAVTNETSMDATPVSEFDVIRYNKQEIKIPVSERQTYLQKGYNYDKVYSQFQEANKQAQAVERLAKLQGFNNTDEFLSALDSYEQEQNIRRQAEQLGVDETVIREHLNPLKSELDTLKKQNEELRRYELQRMVDADISRMREKYHDFDQYENDIFDLASKGLDLEQAYRLASFENIQKRIEQEVMSRIRERDGKQVLSSSDRGTQQKIKPQEMSLEDIESISARVARGERISF
jgi:hypothetical protein